MKELGSLKYFLGIKIAGNLVSIYLYQWKCTLEIISEASLYGTKPSPTPIEPNHNLANVSDPFFNMLARYH